MKSELFNFGLDDTIFPVEVQSMDDVLDNVGIVGLEYVTHACYWLPP